jgi:hypothetical protein
VMPALPRDERSCAGGSRCGSWGRQGWLVSRRNAALRFRGEEFDGTVEPVTGWAPDHGTFKWPIG